MNIQDAAVKAKAEGKKMLLPGIEGSFSILITPTNGMDCCLLECKEWIMPPKRRWNPKVKDLISDDWEVV